MTEDTALIAGRESSRQADQAREHASHPDARELFSQATELLGKAVRIEQEADDDE